MNFIQFATTKTFVKHFAASVAILIALGWLILTLLGSFTMHGVSVTVPKLVDLTMDQINQLESVDDFEINIVDSVFNPRKLPGTVLSQDPVPGSQVKKGRMIYVSVATSLPEMIGMPDLTDLSLRQAKALLQTFGLNFGNATTTPNADRNVVLGQFFRGAAIKSGQPIRKGSAIDLLVGSGRAQTTVQVPFLIGIQRSEAIAILNRMGLVKGEESFEDGADSLNARVYHQDPVFVVGKKVNAGQPVHLIYKSNEFDFESYLHTLVIDTIKE